MITLDGGVAGPAGSIDGRS